MRIHIVGLGPGSIDQISLRTYRLLTGAEKHQVPVFIRTAEHPVISVLENEGMKAEYLDNFYQYTKDPGTEDFESEGIGNSKNENSDAGNMNKMHLSESVSFEQVYDNIANYLTEQVRLHGEIIYAVPGHPYVAETTVSKLESLAAKGNIEVEVYPSMSFIDAVFASVKRDPSDGFCLVDAFAVDGYQLDVLKDLVVTQIYEDMIASSVKVKLLEVYDDEHQVYIVKNAGIKESEQIRKCALYEIDKGIWEFDHLTTLYIPAAEEKKFRTIDDLSVIIKTLRGPDGCPWDKKQTHQSIKDLILDEAKEVAEAIDNDDIENLVEELGDVLLHIMFHCELGAEEGWFNFNDVTDAICKKLIFRHPHVFSDLQIEEKDLPEMWEKLKKIEKNMKKT